MVRPLHSAEELERIRRLTRLFRRFCRTEVYVRRHPQVVAEVRKRVGKARGECLLAWRAVYVLKDDPGCTAEDRVGRARRLREIRDWAAALGMHPDRLPEIWERVDARDIP